MVIRRSFWFFLGMLAGVYGARWARRNIESVSKNLTPSALLELVISLVGTIARTTVAGVTRLVESVGDRNGPTSA